MNASVTKTFFRPSELSTSDKKLGVVERTAAWARMSPQALAVRARNMSLSYADLEDRANRLARRLRSLGVGAEVVVAVWFPRSIALIVAELAILKAGGAYLPLDPSCPPERLAFLLKDAGLFVVLAPECKAEQVPKGAWRVIGLDSEGRDGEFTDCAIGLPTKRAAEQIAYLIYTSGSTGQPKGVEITHANLENLVAWHQRAFEITAADRGSLLSNPAFDASVWETWPYLSAGASLHVPDPCTRFSADQLHEWFLEEKITVTFLPPALAEPMLDLRWPRDSSLRWLLTGADTVRRRPSRPLPFRFVNNYGPTECTVVAASGEVSAQDVENGLPSIGKAIDNIQIHVLDSELNPVPTGDAGELYIGGAGVGRGYRNQQKMTAERFVPDPFNQPGARLYRTGDLARARATGEIDFLGRVDEQIKIRGHRIEPNEIALAMDQNPLVAASVVVARNMNQEVRLVAYVVPASTLTISPRGMQEFLKSKLPDYMIPSIFVRINGMPLTSNGKLDRAALPEPDNTNAIVDEDFTAPSTPVEETLARIAAELLHVERVSVHDNFFLMGGHSLMGTQLVTRVNQHFGIDLGLREVFEAPTIQELAARVEDKVLQKISSMSEEDVRDLLGKASKGAGEEAR